MPFKVDDAIKARKTQQPGPPDARHSKAAEEASGPERSSHASAIAHHCQQEQESTHKSGDYAMQRWLYESPQQGPWSTVVAHAESANGEKRKAQQEQEHLSKPGDDRKRYGGN